MFGPSCLLFCYQKTETRHFVLPLVQIPIARTRNRQQAVSFSNCHPRHAACTLTCVSCLQIPFFHVITSSLSSIIYRIYVRQLAAPPPSSPPTTARCKRVIWICKKKKSHNDSTRWSSWQRCIVFFLVCFARLLRAATSSRLAKAVNIWHIFLLRVSLGVWLRSSSTDHRTADCFSPFGHVWTCFFFGTLVDWCWIFFHRTYVRVALICQLKNYIFFAEKKQGWNKTSES